MNYNKPIWTFAFLLFLVTSLAISANAQCNEHKELIAKMDKALADKNADLLAEVYHADAKRHHPDGTAEGLAKIQEEAKTFYTQVPDAIGTNKDVFCSGNKIVSRWVGKGTPQGSGKEVKVTGITIFHLKDGKVIEEWEEMSSLSLMMQLGFELKPPGDDGGR